MAAPAAVQKDPSEPIVPTGLEIADRLVSELLDALRDLLSVSGIYYDDFNRRSSGIFVVGWNVWQWKELPEEAAPKVGAARLALRRLADFSESATRGASDVAERLASLRESFERLVEQPGGSLPGGAPKSTIDLVSEWAEEQGSAYLQAVRGLPSAFGDGERLIVADTSALLDRPVLDEWQVPGGPWTLVLLPRVLSELDDRKRDNRTRDAAQKVINQIEEFDRRGSTLDGVPLAGNSKFREVPTSPAMHETLPWLRGDVPDDEVVAGALELVWDDLTARVAIVASDRNVRNKARLAGLGAIRASDL